MTSDERARRLAEALRLNLRRRRTQSREREEGLSAPLQEPDMGPGGRTDAHEAGIGGRWAAAGDRDEDGDASGRPAGADSAGADLARGGSGGRGSGGRGSGGRDGGGGAG